MHKQVRGKKIILDGFNNLTKSLSFNIYDVCYAKSTDSQIDYLEYIDEVYNSQKLLHIIEQVTNIIGATLINVSTQDYDPRGASVTALINEGIGSHTIAGHLDKSHITAHTYPEYHKSTGLASFRVDIDVSTCGMISPLNALHLLINNFESDIVIIDYRIRGFTRDTNGTKFYLDHDITSIQNFIADDILQLYHAYDININSANIFHTKMMKKLLNLDDYLFGSDSVTDMPKKQRDIIQSLLQQEIQEIFESHNLL